ncbi:unnamed protein product [Echinostoma caproni]|uniref:Uncharacterized protein n=1 Tax=Echinostoma caproni TaxID=27848 RepID=A0A3P8GLF8_9TREM|nr:unnamed protein product [Echinostoma caproni]
MAKNSVKLYEIPFDVVGAVSSTQMELLIARVPGSQDKQASDTDLASVGSAITMLPEGHLVQLITA